MGNVQAIDAQSRMIDRLASTTSKAELRVMHYDILEQRIQLSEVVAMFKQQSQQIEKLVSGHW